MYSVNKGIYTYQNSVAKNNTLFPGLEDMVDDYVVVFQLTYSHIKLLITKTPSIMASLLLYGVSVRN